MSGKTNTKPRAIDHVAQWGAETGLYSCPPAIHTCHAPSLRCLLDLLLVIPSQLREPVHLDVRLPDGVAHLPEAGEVVPVWDLSVEHGRLKSQSREVRETLISVGTSPPCPQPRRPAWCSLMSHNGLQMDEKQLSTSHLKYFPKSNFLNNYGWPPPNPPTQEEMLAPGSFRV